MLPAILTALIAASCALAQPYRVAKETASGPGSPAIVVLHGPSVRAAIAPSEGGELTSLSVLHKGKWIELIYRARDYTADTAFRGKAPLLWPAVGGQYLPGSTPKSSCVDGEYALGGKTYPMPCHGFAKSLRWELVASAADSKAARATVRLRDSEKTRQSYPFGFELSATYTLAQGKLAIAYKLTASPRNERPMIFGIGNHIAFRVPFLAGTDPGAMMFQSPSTAVMLRDEHGLLSGERGPRSFATPTRLDQFSATTALPLTGYQGDTFAELRDPQGLSVRITHKTAGWPAEPVVRFNVFGDPKLGYFSPEPWVGVQNSLNSRLGLIELEPGKEWMWEVEVAPRPAAKQELTAAPAPRVAPPPRSQRRRTSSSPDTPRAAPSAPCSPAAA